MNNTVNSTNTFEWIDYTVFSMMLALNAFIFLYFGLFGKKQDSPEEYLHGGRKLKLLPIVASLIASDVSSILMLAIPAHTYIYGTSFLWTILAAFVSNLIIMYLYLPVFYNLQTSSCFEYLKIRFSRRNRGMASATYTLNQCLYLPIVMYTSVLAFGQVSKVNLNLLIVIVCIICVAYTTLGGIRAIVWADTLQMCIMVGTMFILIYLGVSAEPNGFKHIWETSLKTSRIDTNLDFDPTSSTAAFTILFGIVFVQLSYGCNPIFIQRFLSLPTKKNIRISVHLFTIAILFFRSIATFLGLVIYTRYVHCDPMSSGSIQRLYQLVPYYVIDVTGSVPGIRGVFIAGIFCTSISTMSSYLNTLSGTIYQDFIKDRMPTNTTDKRASDIMKIIGAVLGIISMILVFVVQHLGGIFEVTNIVREPVTGSMLAMFTLGMLVPIINEKGMFYGSLGGSLIMLWLTVGARYYAMSGHIVSQKLPVSTEGCLIPSNITMRNYTIPKMLNGNEDESVPFYLYRISFYYYCLIGMIATTVIALPVSWFTREKNDNSINKNLYSPIITQFISKHNYTRREDLINIKELEPLHKKFVGNN